MVTQQQQNDLLVGPKTTLWILAVCLVLCLIAAVLARQTRPENTALQVDQIYPGVVDQGQMGTSWPQRQSTQMYELRENAGAGNTSPGGHATGAGSVSR